VVSGLAARRSLHAFARLAVPLADASRFLAAEAEAGDLDLGEGDGDDVFALASDQLALGEVLAEFLLDPPRTIWRNRFTSRSILRSIIATGTCRQRPPSRYVAATVKARVRDFPRRDKNGPAGSAEGVLQCARRRDRAFSAAEQGRIFDEVLRHLPLRVPQRLQHLSARPGAPARTADLFPGMVCAANTRSSRRSARAGWRRSTASAISRSERSAP
jgi:hypothetical protein